MTQTSHPQTAHQEVQTALYTILSPGGAPEPELASLGVLGIFDLRAVPQNQAFPYITLGDAYEVPSNTFGRRGYLLYETIHIWSRQRGTSEASAIVARLNTLIDQQPLALATHSHISTMYSRAIWLADPDGLTLHVALKYEIFTQE